MTNFRFKQPKIFLILAAVVILSFVGVYFSQAQTDTAANTSANYNQFSSTSTSPSYCSAITYSEWGECVSNRQTRTVLNRFPAGCVGGYLEPLERPCCQADVWDCQWSTECLNGQQSKSCRLVQDCPNDNTPPPIETRACSQSGLPPCQYVVVWSGICNQGLEYQRIEKKYPELCQDRQIVLESRACTESTAEVYKPKDCGTETWNCSAWQPEQCVVGARRSRSCVLRPECLPTDNKPAETELCPALNNTDNRPLCEYIYSDWSDCQAGRRSRRVLVVKPEDCRPGSQLALTENCSAGATCLRDEWSCDDWSDCQAGYQRRRCQLKFDCPTASSTPPALQKPCSLTTTTTKDQDADRAILPPTPTRPTTTNLAPPTSTKTTADDSEPAVESVNRELATPAVEPSASTKQAPDTSLTSLSQALPSQCLSAGYRELADCELYLRRLDVAGECLSAGLNDKDACRRYLLEHYGQPQKCQKLTANQCQLLIDAVILADFNQQQRFSVEQQQQLVQQVNRPATLDNAKNILVVQPLAGVDEPGAVKELPLPLSPLSPASPTVEVRLLATSRSAEQQNLAPVAIVLDQDGDGLPDDVEIRLGTKPDNSDSDNDGYDDATELRTGNDPLRAAAKKQPPLAPVDLAILAGRPLEQPKYKKWSDSQLASVDVASAERDGQAYLNFSGKAAPNQVVTLYVYSQLPIVVTVQADANGNWVYQLNHPLADGQHEVYVAVNNDQGEIQTAAAPTAFLIKEARAVTIDDYVSLDEIAVSPDNGKNLLLFYLVGSLALVSGLLVGLWWLRHRLDI